MLRRGQRAGLHPLRRPTRAVGRESDRSALAQIAHEPQQTRFPPPLRGAAHHTIPPTLGQLGEVAAIAMTADQESYALVPPVVQQREDATVPQHVDYGPPARSSGGHVLPPLDAVAPGRRQQAYESCHERRHQGLGPAELHPASSRASVATRSAAPGGPSSCRTSPNPSRWRRAASLSGSSNGSTAFARAAGVTAPWSSSGLTSRPAMRFTRPTWGTCNMRMAMANDTGLRRYAMTMGTSASAASRVVVPDLQRPASAAANTVRGSPMCSRMAPGAG